VFNTSRKEPEKMKSTGTICLGMSVMMWIAGGATGCGGHRGAILEQTDVFVAGQDGIFEYRIPVLVTSNKGTLLAFCDARVKKRGDPPNNIDLVMKRSTDGGKTWSPLKTQSRRRHDLVGSGRRCRAD